MFKSRARQHETQSYQCNNILSKTELWKLGGIISALF